MIKVYLTGHNYEYEVKELLKLFYPPEAVEFEPEENAEDFSEEKLISQISLNHDYVRVHTSYYLRGETISLQETSQIDGQNLQRLEKRLIKRGIFKLLKEKKESYLPWGILTGIRPTKIVHELMERGVGQGEILQELQEEYLIHEDKAQLLVDVAQREYPYLYPLDDGKVSVYISIPFCPTRCVYCSFPSNPLKQWSHLQEPYVEALCREIRGVAPILKRTGKQIETLYIGGGTPSVLTIEQLKQLDDCIKEAFLLDTLKEFTFEAGRPDTIDAPKLEKLRQMGVTRLSINPQTMNDCTLRAIGRNHSVEALKSAYYLAKEMGFEEINMDLIIGLPGETPEMVRHTMEEIEALSPVNLTVHTLALKNASKLKEEKGTYRLTEGAEILKMLKITQDYAAAMGLQPYYMYRQKHMLGHLENIGYCKPGYEGIYNIKIMEEKQTIIAFGAGAVSKFVYLDENRLERVPNVKNLEQYLNRVEEMVQRKIKYL
ncbi:coproporphyrinogen dehydrogenase HemZ [Alkaliphilus crotonatoxidans]